MVDKQVRGKYTLEYKLEAVRQVKAGQSGAVVAKVLGIPSKQAPPAGGARSCAAMLQP